MRWWRSRQSVPWLLAALTAATAILLLLIPPERTLGGVIRVIFVHGALVQVGLVAFAGAGIAGALYLIRRQESAATWMMAWQQCALLIWIVYALASMWSTYLAWGQWIAWDEPRVRASAYVLVFALACWLVGRWVGSTSFASLVNIATAVVAWTLVKGATIFRHPFDPIGASGSDTYRLIFALLLLVFMAAAILMARWLRPFAGSSNGRLLPCRGSPTRKAA